MRARAAQLLLAAFSFTVNAWSQAAVQRPLHFMLSTARSSGFSGRLCDMDVYVAVLVGDAGE
jgi:hypothetical protein